MDIVCKHCSATFRAALTAPLLAPVRVICPSCRNQMVLRPTAPSAPLADQRPAPVATPAPTQPAPPAKLAADRRAAATAARSAPASPAASSATVLTPPAPAPKPARPVPPPGKRTAVIADEPREFRNFLGKQLETMGFEVRFCDNGPDAMESVRQTRAQLVILNVYLKGKLGVEISEEIKADATLTDTRVVLVGALFRANRFRRNPTNLYGADEYIEEQIPARELQQIVQKLFPGVSAEVTEAVEPREFDEARRLARLILSDIVIYNREKVDRGIRDDNFFEVLKAEIDEGRVYYDSRVPFKVRQKTELFSETLQLFVQMKREELGKGRVAPESS